MGFAGYNPLYPSLMVNFNVALLPDNSTETLDRFCAEVGAQEGVTGVAYQENVVGELRDIFYKLSWFLIVFVVLLLLITIVLISSLIRIALYSSRDTIATMRLVGAKASFIARPFRLRSIAYGAIGGLIADCLTFFTLWAFSNEFRPRPHEPRAPAVVRTHRGGHHPCRHRHRLPLHGLHRPNPYLQKLNR